MLPDFNRLKVFYYVFNLKSIVAAANQLHVTQPAVSQHIQKLESELKTTLFIRLHKKLAPTAAADRLFGIIKPFVEELDAGVKSIMQARERPSGLLRIGSPVEFGKEYFPGIFAGFRRQYPEVHYFLKLADPASLFASVREGELDFALIDVFLTQEQLLGDFGFYSIEPLVEEEVILACSREYYDRSIHKDHSFDHLASKEFISYEFRTLALKNWFKHHFGKSPAKLNVVMTVESHQTVITGMKNHLGLGIVASHLVWDEISRGVIVPVSTRKKEVINWISLLQLQDKTPNLTERTFLAYLKEEIRLSGMLKDFPKLPKRKH